MFLIKACPACNEPVRFPIDKGKIKITCKCSHSFVIDPDDPTLYENASFDLKYNQKNRRSSRNKFSFNQLINNSIRKILQQKYDLQNFKLLPNKRKVEIVVQYLFMLTIVIAAILILSKFLCNTQSMTQHPTI